MGDKPRDPALSWYRSAEAKAQAEAYQAAEEAEDARELAESEALYPTLFAFARELTELSRRHGIMILPNVNMFVQHLAPDDVGGAYAVWGFETGWDGQPVAVIDWQQ